jgi:hypothetical protein
MTKTKLWQELDGQKWTFSYYLFIIVSQMHEHEVNQLQTVKDAQKSSVTLSACFMFP